MRISLLVKRENFYKILQKTVIENTFFHQYNSPKSNRFYVNEYLNFIAHNNTPSGIFSNLRNEYSNSLIWWRKGVQKFYVNLATSKLFRSLFAQKSISLPAPSHYLIIGGNHSLRLFDKELKSTWSLLKSGERIDYIKNDLKVRTGFKLSYIPHILNKGLDWIEEEYVEGSPLNRLNHLPTRNKLKDLVLNLHRLELVDRSKKSLALLAYKKMVYEEIDSITQADAIATESAVIHKAYGLLDRLFACLKVDSVTVSWTHGDFQMANILVKDDRVVVIDWESANLRFKDYDFFVLLGEIRTGIRLPEVVSSYQRMASAYGLSVDINSIICCLIEELRFLVAEDFSANFYFSGKKVMKLGTQIEEMIHEFE